MRKLLTTLALCAVASTGWAQTATELVGKWQLVGLKDPKGKTLSVEEALGTKQVFQVFSAPNGFEGLVGDQRARGTWALSPDNKTLTVKVEGQTVKFRVESFTAQTRVIYAEEMGTLSYEKR